MGRSPVPLYRHNVERVRPADWQRPLPPVSARREFAQALCRLRRGVPAALRGTASGPAAAPRRLRSTYSITMCLGGRGPASRAATTLSQRRTPYRVVQCAGDPGCDLGLAASPRRSIRWEPSPEEAVCATAPAPSPAASPRASWVARPALAWRPSHLPAGWWRSPVAPQPRSAGSPAAAFRRAPAGRGAC